MKIEANTNMGDHQKARKILYENDVPETRKRCSHVGAVFTYTKRLVSKRNPNHCKQVIEELPKLILQSTNEFKIHFQNDAHPI